MDAQQLKLLAGRVRGLLEQQTHPVTHGQALDLVASLPGLRNWPEVGAFPDRVAECDLTETTVARLARRLHLRYGVDFDAPSLLAALEPPGSAVAAGERPPELWPSGPVPGLYVTASKTAIDALVAKYEEATDGALLYAEEAAGHTDGGINLGEHGLWSQGLQRAPSGTLIVVGPLALSQRDWQENVERVQQACNLAMTAGHRVALLLQTPAPAQLRDDVLLLAKSVEPDLEDLHEALRGVVTEEGDLVTVEPFVKALAKPVVTLSPAPTVELRPDLLSVLAGAIAKKCFGILAIGSNEHSEDRAVFLQTMLPLTEAAGPVARIAPTLEWGYGNEPPLSDYFQGIPTMPSIESAYVHGYRRMVLEKGFVEFDDLKAYMGEVCFIIGAFSSKAEDALFNAVRASGEDDRDLLANSIAVLGIGIVPGKGGHPQIYDVYVTSANEPVPSGSYSDILRHIDSHRVLRWEDELEDLLSRKQVTPAQVKKALHRHAGVSEFLAARGKRRALAKG